MPEQINPEPTPPATPATPALKRRLVIEMDEMMVRRFTNDVNLFAHGDVNAFIVRSFSLYRSLCQDSPAGHCFIRFEGDKAEQKLPLWTPRPVTAQSVPTIHVSDFPKNGLSKS